MGADEHNDLLIRITMFSCNSDRCSRTTPRSYLPGFNAPAPYLIHCAAALSLTFAHQCNCGSAIPTCYRGAYSPFNDP